jgi:hypothetical protein
MIGEQIPYGPNDGVISGQQIVIGCEKNYVGEPL